MAISVSIKMSYVVRLRIVLSIIMNKRSAFNYFNSDFRRGLSVTEK